ncbi:MAG: hypothetical protein K8U57_05945 [Planctomycetes bacterium]|nr:hypothetical protein [Planctomycetota bacterium]
MKRLLRPETLFFLAVWIMLLIAFRERGFWDPGSLWHIKVGDIIRTQGMPQTDPFSYTMENKPWVPQQWGAEVLMSLTHALGGFDLLLLAFSTGVALLFTLIFRRCIVSPSTDIPGTTISGGMGPILAALIVGACIFVGAFHYYVRPHMFTIVLLGWTMMCIIDYERGWCSIRRLAALIPLYVIWTNLHGGVLGGTMSLGLAVAGWGVLFLAGRARNVTPIQDWRTAWLLVGIVVACLLTPLINPHGLKMLDIWYRLLVSKVMPAVISEHQPMDVTSEVGIMIVGLGVFYIALLLGTLPKWPRVSWFIPLVWLLLTFKSIRQGPLFTITAAVCIADMWRYTCWHRYLVKNGDGSLAWNAEDDPARLATVRNGNLWWVIPAAFVLLAFALQLAGVRVPVIGHGWVRFDKDFVPEDMNDEINKYMESVPPGTHIFNDLDLGGYMIWYAPKLKIYMDDRCELYGDDMLKEYADTIKLPPEEFGVVFEGWREKWKFDRAIIWSEPKDETKPNDGKPPMEVYFLSHPERWREVARGKRAVMFELIR